MIASSPSSTIASIPQRPRFGHAPGGSLAAEQRFRTSRSGPPPHQSRGLARHRGRVSFKAFKLQSLHITLLLPAVLPRKNSRLQRWGVNVLLEENQGESSLGLDCCAIPHL
jgi:hypothetical protein